VAGQFRQGVGVYGDFFNWYTTNDGDTWLYLVDVEGRGFPAAITSTLIRHVLDSTLESAANADPWEVLRRVDQQFENYGTTRDLTATMNLFRVSTSKKLLQLANAGMPAPLRFRYGQAQADPIHAAGVYVGSGYSHYKIEPALARETIDIGDLIVAYSDGVIEGRNKAGNPWGVVGLSSQVMRYRDADVDEIATRIIEGVAYHSGTEMAQDDQCVVVIRIGSNAERRRENRAPTLGVSRNSSGGKAEIEFTIVNSIDAMREIGLTLRREVLDWAKQVSWDGDPGRLWMGVFEAILNSLRHATNKGDRVRVILRTENSIAVVELHQPSEWRDWDKSLGPDRRALVDSLARLSPEMSQWGTLLMLWYSDSLEVLRQGRLIRMNFRPKWRKG
jgi:anti-sigma regulatory factor (Ser/Thr protein kinase)